MIYLYNRKRETEKAVCIDVIDFFGNIIKYSIWLPKNYIKILNNEKIEIPAWLMKK